MIAMPPRRSCGCE